MDTSRPASLPAETVAFAQQFFGAARANDPAGILKNALESKLPPDLTNSNGDTLLMLASYHGHVELTKLLLSHNANPNLLNDRHQSCLSGAIFKNETEIVQLLLDHLADPDLGDPSGAKACELFGRGEMWKDAFEVTREKIKAKSA